MPNQRATSPTKIGWIVAAWVILVVVATLPILDYSNEAGALARAPESWPQSSTIRPHAESPSLIFFAHPRCPCTRASLNELARLLATVGDSVHTEVVFYEPEGRDWPETPLEELARSIESVHIRRDPEAREARRFGVETSGQVLLYDRRGQLLFNGGVTPLRGHEGANVGRDSLRALIEESRSEPTQSPVFGCTISEDCLLESRP